MKISRVSGATVPGRLEVAGTEARPTGLFPYNGSRPGGCDKVIQEFYPKQRRQKCSVRFSHHRVARETRPTAQICRAGTARRESAQAESLRHPNFSRLSAADDGLAIES